jgi:23S rRNA (guanosine2251-2'-O)-methyltransferase
MSKKANSLLTGIHAVASALESGSGQLRQVYVTEGSRNNRVRDLAQKAKQKGVAVMFRSREELDRLAGGTRHQDIIAEFEPANLAGEAELPALLDAIDGDPLLLVLDNVQDPHNLGACLRTAEAAGVHLVIIPKDRSVGLTPVARKVASGAAEIIKLVQVTNLARTLRDLKQRGIWLAGTSDAASQTLYEADLKGPLAVVMGGEGDGMRRLTSETCDFLVNIPMAGVVDSLNVSVATGVTLFEVIRQRGGSS